MQQDLQGPRPRSQVMRVPVFPELVVMGIGLLTLGSFDPVDGERRSWQRGVLGTAAGHVGATDHQAFAVCQAAPLPAEYPSDILPSPSTASQLTPRRSSSRSAGRRRSEREPCRALLQASLPGPGPGVGRAANTSKGILLGVRHATIIDVAGLQAPRLNRASSSVSACADTNP